MSKTRVVVQQYPTADDAGRAALALLAMGLEADVRRVQVVLVENPPGDHTGDADHTTAVGVHGASPIDATTSMGGVTSAPAVALRGAPPTIGLRASPTVVLGAPPGDALRAAPTDALRGTPTDALLASPTDALGATLAVANAWQISVADDEVEQALAILDGALVADDAIPPAAAAPPLLADAGAGIWTAANASSSIAIAVVCIVIHLVVHGGIGPSARSTMIEAGAVAPWLVREGQWWRMLTAVFLHFDLKHLIGNTSSLLFLGPPLAAQIGHLRMIALFLVTGVAGNLVSQMFGDEAAIRAGASGGICGLLGALAGVALATMASATDASERRPAWQTLGALVALFGMIVGFEPGHDHYAHVGGVLAGVVMGRSFGLRAAGQGIA